MSITNNISKMEKEAFMLFEVRILDSKGKMKKRVSPPELSRRHWKTFDEHFSFPIKNNSRKKMPKE